MTISASEHYSAAPRQAGQDFSGVPCTHQFLGTLTVPTTNIKPRSHHRPHRHPQRPKPTPWSSYPVTVNIEVARCTVERLMRANGWQGVTRARKVRTTEPDPDATRPPDLVDRQFAVPAPNMLVVADFTYVRLSTGMFVYTAFAIDAFAGRIVGWQCSASKHTTFVESAIRQAANLRERDGNPLNGHTIHHSDAGSQYTSVRFGETLMLAGLIPSIGSVGDAYDNALAETTIGLYKTEAVRKDSPFRRGPLDRLADVELLTADWVHWYNNHRLMHRLERTPPVEYEAAYYAERATAETEAHQ